VHACGCGKIISDRKTMCIACMWMEAQRRAEKMKAIKQDLHICPQCGKEFWTGKSYRRFCSKTCCDKYNHSLIEIRKCDACGKEFEARRISQAKKCPICRKIRPAHNSTGKARTRKCAFTANVDNRPDGACEKDMWMGDLGHIPVSRTQLTKAKARIRIPLEKLPKPMLEPTRQWTGETAEDIALRKLARQQEHQKQYFNQDKKRNCHPRDGYTMEEDALILEMDDAGSSLEDIAKMIGRAKEGVRYRLKRLRRDQDDLRKLLQNTAVL